MEARIFWLSLVACEAIWIFLIFSTLLRLRFAWLVSVHIFLVKENHNWTVNACYTLQSVLFVDAKFHNLLFIYECQISVVYTFFASSHLKKWTLCVQYLDVNLESFYFHEFLHLVKISSYMVVMPNFDFAYLNYLSCKHSYFDTCTEVRPIRFNFFLFSMLNLVLSSYVVDNIFSVKQ